MNSQNEIVKKKGLKEFDVRDVGYFLLKKSWIIAIAAFVCLVFALGYTALIPEKFVTNTRTFLIAGNGDSSNAWAIGERTVENTPTLIDGNAFCAEVRDILNDDGKLHQFLDDKNNAQIKEKLNAYLVQNGRASVDNSNITHFNEGKKVTEGDVIGWIKAEVTGKDLNTFTITAETKDPALSYLVANVATSHYKTYICAAMTNDLSEPIQTLTYEINDTGAVASAPSNKNFASNSVIAAIAGALVAVVVLIIVFIFDDRIKTPDDIQKHLGLNILGTIPDFEDKRGAK